MLNRSLIFATRNQGKTLELKELLAGFDIDIKNLKDFGPIPPVVEDGEAFEDNAYKKAHFTAKILGAPALADDSGLAVEAIYGAPGIHSHRYAGDDATDEDNNVKLLEEMKGETNRNAFFESVIVIAVPKGPALTYQGRCYGEIAYEQKGENGFGYDPIFYYPPLKKTFAQISREEKNRVSHRGKAMFGLRNEFDKVMIWLAQRMAEEHF
ncbi:XTP/dITP diphosphatase [Thermodesulfobacteriota bacterium]